MGLGLETTACQPEVRLQLDADLARDCMVFRISAQNFHHSDFNAF